MRKFTLILSLLAAMVTTAMAQITSVTEFSNDKCYTITVGDNGRGTWYYNSEDPAALYSTGKLGISVDTTDPNQQFAFVEYEGSYYLYSVGAQKFVNKNGNYTSLSDTPNHTITLDATTGTTFNESYPVVVSLNGSHIGVSNSYDYGIITFYNSTDDGGNCVAINEVADATFDSSDAIAAIQEYLNAEAAKEYVTAIEDFANDGVYTFISNRSDNAYMMYDANTTTDYFISQYMYTSLTVGSDVANCQWAVYKSDNGFYYMYNIGAQKFLGTESTNNTDIPASDTPQTTKLTFKLSSVDTHPIMISSDGGTSVVNHSNQYGNGLISWNGGWGVTGDAGNVHKVEKVGTLDDTTIATIEAAVEAYEAIGMYTSELESLISDTKTKYYDSWNATWRIGEGMNSYSLIDETAAPINEVVAAAETYLAGTDVTAEGAQSHISAINNAIDNITINLPEDGKFYRIRCTATGMKYLSSEINDNSRLVMNGSENARIFMYTNGALLSYTEGLYINAYNLNEIGITSAVTFSEGKPGSYYVNVGGRYIYGDGDGIDSGAGTPDSRDGYSWWIEEVTSLPVSVSAAGYATAYFPVATTIPGDVTAYVLTSTSENSAVLTALEGTIPANQGVIIAANEGSYDFVITNDVEFEGTNMLTGAAATANVSSSATTLTLQNNATEGIGLYKYTGSEVGTFKAHLELPAELQSNGFSFRIEGTTAIDEVETSEAGEQVIYDLTGRRVESINASGIYIVNGKKVVVK